MTENMTPPLRSVREYIGFAWQEDWEDKVGLLVEAVDALEAKSLAQATLGPSFRVSVWNEEEARAAR